jgi:hypothetical protein
MLNMAKAKTAQKWVVWPPRLHGFVHCSLRNHVITEAHHSKALVYVSWFYPCS